MSSLKKRILALILTAAMLMSFMPFTLTASAAGAGDDGIAGYLMDIPEEEMFVTYNNKYVNYGTRLFMKKDQDPLSHSASYGQGNGSGVYIRKSGDEYFAILNPQESYDADNKLKEANGGLYYNTISGRGLGEDGSALAGMPSDVDTSTLTHLAIRFRVTGGEADQYSSVSLTYNNSAFISLSSAYLIDSVSGEIIDPNFTSHRLAITGEFDGWLVLSYASLTSAAKTALESTGKALYAYFHSELCSNSTHGPDTKSNWANKILWFGDIALIDDESNFKKTYGGPNFELASSNSTITVISDEADAVYSLDKNADSSLWLSKDAFNATLTGLSKGTKYTIYAKYTTETKIVSKEIATTATGVLGYLMDIPEEETFLTYNNKYVNYGTRLFMKKDQDPLSHTATYGAGSGSGVYIRKSGDEYFAILNPQESYDDDNKLKEANGGLYFNTVSGRGLGEDGSAIAGMPEHIDRRAITHLAIRFKVTGGEADQYSSVSLSHNNSGFIDLSAAYLIDNTSGLVVNPKFTSHRLAITGEFDGWLVIPYEYITSTPRAALESTGKAIYPYFHSELCSGSTHGPDTKSNWANKILWFGDIALVEDEQDFLNTYTRPLETSGGITFSNNDLDYIDGAFSDMINTFEATVMLPENFPATMSGGVIMGSYANRMTGINFEIHKNGNPRVFWSEKISTGTDTWEKIFDQVNLLNGEKTHIAIVNDQEADTLTCYVNGEVAQTLEGAIPDWIAKSAGVLGGDYRDGNMLSFRGALFSVAVYSDVRTQDEIKADMSEVSSDSNLMAHWDLSKAAVGGKYLDESGNGHDVTIGKVWYTDKATVTDYDYSFAVIGDTQIVNLDYSDRLADIYDWIVENKESKKIEYVMGLGDITDKDYDREWTNADEQIAKLNGVVPYSLVRGNHDGTAKFNSTFDKAPYNTSFAGRYDEKLENTYRELSVGNLKYLIFTLDIGAADEVLAWAGNIIEAHPHHNVIITTHGYLENDGSYVDDSSQVRLTKYGGSNNGDDMWEKFVSQYENIVMVLCGHVSQGRVILNQSKGVNGNVVSQMLVDPQGVDANIGATGMVTMLYFSEDGSKVSVETYSTVRGMYYISHGQFDFNLNVVKHPVAFNSASLTLDNSTAVNFKAPAASLEGFENIHATFAIDGVEEAVRVDAPEADEKGMLVFTFDNIPAEMMGNTITATINATQNDIEYTSTIEYSVEQYCYNKLEKYADYVAGSEYSEDDIEYATSLKKLVVDLLNYGSAVQLYTGTNTDDLVNGDLNDAENALAATHVPEMNGLRAIYNNLDDETVRWTSGNLSFQHNVQLVFAFGFVDGKEVEDVTNYKIVISNDVEGADVIAEIGRADFIDEGNGYCAYYDGFNATEMDRNIYVTVFDGDTQVSDTFAYSISAYARQKYTPDDATNTLSNVVLAMMRYGDAAEGHEIWRGYVA